MAKITITIEDKQMGNKVQAIITPSFAELAMKIKGGHGELTAAEAYGIACINLIMAESKKLDKPTKIVIPRLRGNN